ncbi:transposase [Burkholderia pseudomallei]|nr:transposase [Burkholderia pseudomallei]CAJ5887709.1 transposase [Burkholderia pseudomallei]CAJ7791243.1 transposase [Burkholderia pseudomallei]VBX55094.1 transposase [Burkholderia pseudomallei]VBX58664.1 transposase [Burkholderia pseudomallei]
MQFGRSSEKLDRQIEQLELRLEELEADEGAAPIEIPKTPRTAPEQAPRKPLPEHLPREILTYWPESGETCAAYLTVLPPRETLQAKLHQSIAAARARLDDQREP